MSDKPEKLGYISEADQFLAELHSNPENWTESVEAEIEKHKRIKKLRDNPKENSEKSKLWSDF